MADIYAPANGWAAWQNALANQGQLGQVFGGNGPYAPGAGSVGQASLAGGGNGATIENGRYKTPGFTIGPGGTIAFTGMGMPRPATGGGLGGIGGSGSLNGPGFIGGTSSGSVQGGGGANSGWQQGIMQLLQQQFAENQRAAQQGRQDYLYARDYLTRGPGQYDADPLNQASRGLAANLAANPEAMSDATFQKSINRASNLTNAAANANLQGIMGNLAEGGQLGGSAEQLATQQLERQRSADLANIGSNFEIQRAQQRNADIMNAGNFAQGMAGNRANIYGAAGNALISNPANTLPMDMSGLIAGLAPSMALPEGMSGISGALGGGGAGSGGLPGMGSPQPYIGLGPNRFGAGGGMGGQVGPAGNPTGSGYNPMGGNFNMGGGGNPFGGMQAAGGGGQPQNWQAAGLPGGQPNQGGGQPNQGGGQAPAGGQQPQQPVGQPPPAWGGVPGGNIPTARPNTNPPGVPVGWVQDAQGYWQPAGYNPAANPNRPPTSFPADAFDPNRFDPNFHNNPSYPHLGQYPTNGGGFSGLGGRPSNPFGGLQTIMGGGGSPNPDLGYQDPYNGQFGSAY